MTNSCAKIYRIFQLQKLRNKTTKTEVHLQGRFQYFTVCFLCPKHSLHAKPSPPWEQKALQLFSSTSRVVHCIIEVALFLLESSLSFSLLWFFLPTELFQPPHLLFKVLMLIPVETKVTEFLHEGIVGVVRRIPAVDLLPFG